MKRYEVQGFNKYSAYTMVVVEAKTQEEALKKVLDSNKIKYSRVEKLTRKKNEEYSTKLGFTNALQLAGLIDFVVSLEGSFAPGSTGNWKIIS